MIRHRPAEDMSHPTIKYHDAQERQHKPEAGQSHAVRIVVDGVCGGAQVIAHSPVSLDPRGGEVESGRAQKDDHQPDPAADSPRQLTTAAFVPQRQWVAYAHVALNTDTSQEKNAAVKVTVELKPDQFTHELPKRPVVVPSVVVNEQWEGHHVQEICYGQV